MNHSNDERSDTGCVLCIFEAFIGTDVLYPDTPPGRRQACRKLSELIDAYMQRYAACPDPDTRGKWIELRVRRIRFGDNRYRDGWKGGTVAWVGWDTDTHRYKVMECRPPHFVTFAEPLTEQVPSSTTASNLGIV